MLDVTYRPAVLPGGGVSLSRAVAFTALVQEVMQAKVDDDLARLTDEIDAARLAESTDPSPAVEAPEARTFDELVGNVPIGTDTPVRPAIPAPTGFEVFEAVVNGGWAPRFAAVCVEAVEADGRVRAVTEKEAARDDFPSAPFAAALYDFWEGSAPLMSGLQNTRLGTESRLAATDPT